VLTLFSGEKGGGERDKRRLASHSQAPCPDLGTLLQQRRSCAGSGLGAADSSSCYGITAKKSCLATANLPPEATVRIGESFETKVHKSNQTAAGKPKAVVWLRARGGRVGFVVGLSWRV
jgi:hypothetical protein